MNTIAASTPVDGLITLVSGQPLNAWGESPIGQQVLNDTASHFGVNEPATVPDNLTSIEGSEALVTQKIFEVGDQSLRLQEQISRHSMIPISHSKTSTPSGSTYNLSVSGISLLPVPDSESAILDPTPSKQPAADKLVTLDGTDDSPAKSTPWEISQNTPNPKVPSEIPVVSASYRMPLKHAESKSPSPKKFQRGSGSVILSLLGKMPIDIKGSSPVLNAPESASTITADSLGDICQGYDNQSTPNLFTTEPKSLNTESTMSLGDIYQGYTNTLQDTHDEVDIAIEAGTLNQMTATETENVALVATENAPSVVDAHVAKESQLDDKPGGMTYQSIYDIVFASHISEDFEETLTGSLFNINTPDVPESIDVLLETLQSPLRTFSSIRNALVILRELVTNHHDVIVPKALSILDGILNCQTDAKVSDTNVRAQ
jgi:hypothetical protein